MNTPADSMPGVDARANHLRTVLEDALAKPRFGVTAMHEQTISNAVAFATMSHVFGERTDPVAWLLQPPPVIITIEEGGQIRAAVVRFSSEDGQQHPGKMQTIFQSSLCGSEAEALVLLYERSRTAVTCGKRSLEERGLWQRL